MNALAVDVRHAPLADVEPGVLYRVQRLRVDVFVVEQACAYAELDGRDAEPGAELLWAQTADGTVAATARLLRDADGCARIGRVATAAEFRGAGIAPRLMRLGLELAGDVEVVLDAQAHLEGWYARFGFAVDGPPFTEDEIPHVPMRRRRSA